MKGRGPSYLPPARRISQCRVRSVIRGSCRCRRQPRHYDDFNLSKNPIFFPQGDFVNKVKTKAPQRACERRNARVETTGRACE